MELSVIGKLNFIAANTHPDISFAVHQCARFCANPKAIHDLEVKRIIRYLIATRDKGLIMTPTSTLGLDAYVDGDFAGMWHKKQFHLRENVSSRTGFIITFCGCPVSWGSKLQSEIALSSTESEYIALSMAAREIIPLRRLVQDINKYSFVSLQQPDQYGTITTPTLEASQVYEDNAACIVLANNGNQFKARTKHISLKWHHFQDQIRNGNLRIVKVSIHFNWADVLTKPRGPKKFECLRKLIMGW